MYCIYLDDDDQVVGRAILPDGTTLATGWEEVDASEWGDAQIGAVQTAPATYTEAPAPDRILSCYDFAERFTFAERQAIRDKRALSDAEADALNDWAELTAMEGTVNLDSEDTDDYLDLLVTLTIIDGTRKTEILG
jgi:hypothetical protein